MNAVSDEKVLRLSFQAMEWGGGCKRRPSLKTRDRGVLVVQKTIVSHFEQQREGFCCSKLYISIIEYSGSKNCPNVCMF